MSCDIELDNYEGYYNPGNVISGRVICSLDTNISIRGVEIRLKGKEKNEWRSGGDNYSGKKTFLRSVLTLQREGTLGPGTFVYPFSFELPTDIPSTFNGPYGGVYYTIKAKVDIPFAFDYTDKKTLNIMSPIDFNDMASDLRLRPINYSDETTVGCCCCESGPLTMEVYLEKEAFVVGEVAKIMVVINNMSDENVEEVVAKLKMTIEFKVTDSWRTKDRSITLAEISAGGVSAHGEKTFNLQLNIPQSTEIPNFQRCKLFSQRTKLKVTAVLMNSSDLDISTAVTMGHIPVSGQDRHSPVISQQPTSSNQAPLTLFISSSNPSAASNQDPPPYSPPPEYETPPSIGQIGFNLPKNKEVPPPPGPSAPLLENSASAPPQTDVRGSEFIAADAAAPSRV